MINGRGIVWTPVLVAVRYVLQWKLAPQGFGLCVEGGTLAVIETMETVWRRG